MTEGKKHEKVFVEENLIFLIFAGGRDHGGYADGLQPHRKKCYLPDR